MQIVDTESGEVVGALSEALRSEPRLTPPDEGSPRSLIKKLAEAMGEIENVEARGEGPSGFPYVLESDLMQAVRQALAKRFVMFNPAELARNRTTIHSTKSSGDPQITTVIDVLVRFTFLDGESGETYSFDLTGTRPDRQGEGGAGAITNATKIALSKTFLVPTDGAEGGAGDASQSTRGGGAPALPMG